MTPFARASILPTAARLIALGVLAFASAVSPSWAQAPAGAADPTLDRVYQAAQAGHVDEARQMTNRVVQDHPNSARARYVDAEMLARQGLFGPAQDELAAAERLAPGLPFARPEAAQALRDELASLGGKSNLSLGDSEHAASRANAAAASMPWGLLLAVLAGALLAWSLMLLMRVPRKSPDMALAGPQPAWAAPASGVPGTAAPQMPVGAAAAEPTVVGHQLAGGLATGVGIGAGVLAAGAIGHQLLGHAHEMPMDGPAAFPGSAVQTRSFVPASAIDDRDFGVVERGSCDAKMASPAPPTERPRDWET